MSKTEPSISLEALKAGDPEAFAALVDAYSGMIYRLALKMLNDPDAAEDVLQETFIKAYRHIGRFDGRSRLGTWLYRIATNEALMMLRRRRPEVVSLDEPPAGDAALSEPRQIVDWCCLPEEELLSQEAREYLERAVQQLSPALRSVFVLRDIEGLSTRETAEVLNISEAAVRTRLSRARLQLRELLSAYFGERLR